MSENRGLPTDKKRRYLKILTERDGLYCHYCRVPLEIGGSNDYNPNGVSLDHVVPRIEGGTDHIDNIVLACRRCNGKKRTRHYHEFRLGVETDAVILYLMDAE